MADIFISYAKPDRNLVQQLAAHLEAQGRTTWWDATIGANENPPGATEHELERARKVIVVWSSVSIGSPFVLHEAITARDAGKLLQVKTSNIEVSEVPPSLRTLPFLDASDLAGIADAVAEREERAHEPSVQDMLPTQIPLGRPEDSDPARAAAKSRADVVARVPRPDLTVPPASALGSSPTSGSRAPAEANAKPAAGSMSTGTLIFAIGAALVAVADVAIFWHYGVFDGLSGIGTKLLSLFK